MKKKNATATAMAVAAMLTTGRLFSQDISVGGQLGISAAKWAFSKDSPLGSAYTDWQPIDLVAPCGGFSVGFRASRDVEVQVEAVFSDRGLGMARGGAYPGGHTVSVSRSVVFKTVEVPVLLKCYDTILGEGAYAVLGYSWSWARRGFYRSTVSDCFEGDCSSASTDFPLAPGEFARARSDRGWHLGLGFAIDLRGPVLEIEARRYHGVKNLAPDGALEAVHNRAWLAAVGLRVPVAWL